MRIEEIENLVRLAHGRGLASFEYEADGTVLRFDFSGGEAPRAEPSPSAKADRAPAVPASTPTVAASNTVLSPGVGIFRTKHPLASGDMTEGGLLETGAIVGFVQAGPVLQPVTAPRAGVLGRMLVVEGEKVGFGTPLFELG